MFYFAVDTVVVRFGTYYKIMSGQRSRNIIVGYNVVGILYNL